MENTPTNDLLIPSGNADNLAPEPGLPAPHFDEESIQHARPAVPLVEIKRSRFRRLALVLMIGASLIGAVMGLALSRYQNRSARNATPAARSAPEESRVSTESGKDGFSTASGSDRIVKSAQPEPTEPAQSRAVNGASSSDTQDSDARAALHGALEEWIAATNARDIQRQMNFYQQTVNAFYRTRNVPRAAVRAEKSRVFSHANSIDIRAAAPGIRVSRDGSTATMRFRKKYAIEGGGQDRRGEVVQELRWRRTDDGWKIVSERDLRVIN